MISLGVCGVFGSNRDFASPLFSESSFASFIRGWHKELLLSDTAVSRSDLYGHINDTQTKGKRSVVRKVKMTDFLLTHHRECFLPQ